MSKQLVIVESPTKARTIEKFLGKDFIVLASYGHVRDLPNNAAEIPAEVKKEKWARIGINIDADFEPLYIIPESKKKRVAELRQSLKQADQLLLATDEDREGESISWHLLEVLKPKIPVKRLVFHEITKEAIAEALRSPREVDENLVKAQETRRTIDRLFGYSVSPLLWKKMAPRLSAGRVQSVSLRLLVERERERISFRRAIYWDLKAQFAKSGESFDADLTHVDGKRVASGKDFDPNTGKLKSDTDCVLLNEASALELRQQIEKSTPIVSSVEAKPFTTKPYPPFTTSTLQQEGVRKLGYAARRTMQVAQQLYENGFITYMRTDSTNLSDEALEGARSLIKNEFGAEFLSEQVRIYKTKVKNAQEAHEAIRPAGAQFTSPDVVRQRLGMEAFKLYDLIWKRTLACQMKDANGTHVSAKIDCGRGTFRASGKTIEFAGYLRAYVEGSDDPEAELAERERILPSMASGDKLDLKELNSLEHTTQPPARFTEGSLIKELERLGIGRPSTWATIVDLVLSREYAFKRGTALVPSFLAMALTKLMEQYFTNLVDYEFTARLEDDLDAVSRGEAQNLDYLRQFYFGNGHPGLKTMVDKGAETIDPRIVCGIALGKDDQGRDLEVRIGRYGPFISNGEDRAGVPDGTAPDEMGVERATVMLAEAKLGPQSLGSDPTSNLPVYLKKGRFGPYVQLGDMVEGGDKPKMASLLPGMAFEEVNFDTALQLLSLPRSLGQHPEMGEEIIAANGRYGPYIKCGTDTRSIPLDSMSPLTITFEQALELFKQPKTRGRASSQPKKLRELGKHPDTGKEISVKSGRYGPYVTDGEINATIPQGDDPESITIEQAVSLLAARADKIAAGGGKPKRRGGASKSKKSAAPADANGTSKPKRSRAKKTKSSESEADVRE